MRKFFSSYFQTLLLFGLGFPGPATALPEGAPPGHSGGFGEPSCASCHMGVAPTSNDSLRIEGLPETYKAGERYRLELILSSEGSETGGFQLTLRRAPEQSSGQLVAEGENLGVQTKTGVDYLGHTELRPAPEGEVISWSFNWIAPNINCDPIKLHIAAVAGNDDASPLGDKIFTLHRTLVPASSCP